MRRNTHHKDVCVGLANASILDQGRGNKHHWTFVREQQGVLDADASNSDPHRLLDSDICCQPMGHGNLGDWDVIVVHHHLGEPRRNVHHKDKHVGSAGASTRC